MCRSQEGDEYFDAAGNVQTIRLTVDHINGDTRDRRPSNLRVLCSACHGALTAQGYRR